MKTIWNLNTGNQTQEYREARIRLINKWQYHSQRTGLLEWKLGTPEFVKLLLVEISTEVA